eukprot:gene20453-23231_t
MWQTVAVREVDEAAELVESERVRELMYKGRSHQIDEPTAKAKRHLLQEGEDGFEDHTDSALSAYDPYARQRGIYKGIKLQEDANFKEQIESVAQGATVGFKKRKTAVKTEPSSSSSSNNIATIDQAEPAPIKLEPSASSITPTTTAVSDHATSLAQAPTNPSPATIAASAPAPIVMKIGNMNATGGAKRKFRVREPSP